MRANFLSLSQKHLASVGSQSSGRFLNRVQLGGKTGRSVMVFFFPKSSEPRSGARQSQPMQSDQVPLNLRRATADHGHDRKTQQLLEPARGDRAMRPLG